jgi:hypothetical protein
MVSIIFQVLIDLGSVPDFYLYREKKFFCLFLRPKCFSWESGMYSPITILISFGQYKSQKREISLTNEKGTSKCSFHFVVSVPTRVGLVYDYFFINSDDSCVLS